MNVWQIVLLLECCIGSEAVTAKYDYNKHIPFAST